MNWNKLKEQHIPEMLFLLLIGALAYLPRVWELGYNKDDWYFMYNGLVHGPEVFRDITLHTRPLRGILYQFLYSLFGPSPLPYHLTSFLWRILGAFGALWLFHLLWPADRQRNVWLAVLFLLFPGFYWWVSGFELQPNIISVGLEAFSIACTLKAIETDTLFKRVFYIITAFLSGWIYMAFVEYAIGMEGFRLLCVYVLLRRKHSDLNIRFVLPKLMRGYAVFLLIPLSFVLWYELLFENWRKAQDAASQLGALFNSPVTILWWVIRLMESFLNISIMAWFTPFHENFLSGRLSDILFGLLFALLTVVAFLAGSSFLGATQNLKKSEDSSQPSSSSLEVIWLGALGTIAGVIPIVVANRSAVFSRVSQYTLPASLAGVLLLGGIVFAIFPPRLRITVISCLTAFAVLSHYGLATQAVTEQKRISDFWWQVTWRAPDIRDDTLLIVRYPNINYTDNDEVVWGPANFIYNPQSQPMGPAKILLPAARNEQETNTNIIMGAKDFDRLDLVIKYVSIHYNYKNTLTISQPTEQACVHLMDQRWPDISKDDEPLVHISASNSNASNVIPDKAPPVPQSYLFGEKPDYSWCYFYQKADLARQQGNWQEIVKLAEEAQAQDLHPNDQVEWMPFLQAYAFLGNKREIKIISTKINTEPYYKQQACRNLHNMQTYGYSLSSDITTYTDKLFC